MIAGRVRHPILVAGATVLVLGAAALAIADPFSTTSASTGGFDSAAPTSIATVVRESLSSDTDVDATLQYSASYTVSLPSGTSSQAVTSAQQTLQTAQQQVKSDESAVSQAKALERTEGKATTLQESTQLANDKVTLSKAKSQLAADEKLGCPAASSSTVSSPSTGSSTVVSDASSGGSVRANFISASTTPTSAPTVASEGDSEETTTSAVLSGSITPNGLDTSYFFEYGPTTSYGFTSSAVDIGSGSAQTDVSANISNLSPNTTYLYALVAANADGTTSGVPETFTTAQSSCVEQEQAIKSDEQAVTQDAAAVSANALTVGSSVTTAEQQLASDESAETNAEQAFANAKSTESNPGSTITALPVVGAVLRRGDPVYSLNGEPIPLFYGSTTLWRALYAGVSNGPDIAELQKNLIALGFGPGLVANGQFSAATTAAVESWQRSIGTEPDGVVALGDVVVEPGALKVAKVSAAVGQAAVAGGSTGTILQATSTNHVVMISLDAGQQTEVHAGDKVSVTLPSGATTPGVISSVSSVATAPSSGSSQPTIPVVVRLTDPAAAGNLDQAPVEVGITNASVSNALVVPVDSLLALSGGGDALEVIAPNGAHHLERVSVGIFDDAGGLVQVSGPAVAVGQRIVVPAL